MFTAKLDDQTVNLSIVVIMLTSRKEFTECDQNAPCCDVCKEADEVAMDIVKGARDQVTFGFDSANKKAAKIAAQSAFYEFRRAVAIKNYSSARQKLSDGVRNVLLVSFTGLGRKVFADKIDVFLKSPSLCAPLMDESHESHGASKLMLNSATFALKKELKELGVFRGPINH
jgi:hypothetical protein